MTNIKKLIIVTLGVSTLFLTACNNVGKNGTEEGKISSGEKVGITVQTGNKVENRKNIVINKLKGENKGKFDGNEEKGGIKKIIDENDKEVLYDKKGVPYSGAPADKREIKNTDNDKKELLCIVEENKLDKMEEIIKKLGGSLKKEDLCTKGEKEGYKVENGRLVEISKGEEILNKLKNGDYKFIIGAMGGGQYKISKDLNKVYENTNGVYKKINSEIYILDGKKVNKDELNYTGYIFEDPYKKGVFESIVVKDKKYENITKENIEEVKKYLFNKGCGLQPSGINCYDANEIKQLNLGNYPDTVDKLTNNALLGGKIVYYNYGSGYTYLIYDKNNKIIPLSQSCGGGIVKIFKDKKIYEEENYCEYFKKELSK